MPQLTLRGGWPESLRHFLLHQTTVTPIQTTISVDAFTQEGFCAINTTFKEKIYIRWCCIDRLSWHLLSEWPTTNFPRCVSEPASPLLFSPRLDACRDFPSCLNVAGINTSPITNVATKNPVSD
ncbi:MAG: hypothetical protein DMG32_15185 [Acidobacteria bacterium]|nr:MAG: hypothetical protein DMG32_15185 [Acidobacteriota bacterium]